MEEWLIENAVALGSTVLIGIPTLIFAWRNWERARQVVTIELEPLTEQKKGEGELRGMQLTLHAVLRARRNNAYIKAAYLVVGRDRVIGRDTSENASEARLRIGEPAHRFWALTAVRHLPRDKSWKVCWLDSEDSLDCPRGAKVSKEDVRLLTTSKTRAEAVDPQA